MRVLICKTRLSIGGVNTLVPYADIIESEHFNKNV